jgi:hypothetical protein
MDEKQHLREVAAELAGSKLTRTERVDAEAQLARGTTGAAHTHPGATREKSATRPATSSNASLEAAVSVVENRYQDAPSSPAATSGTSTPLAAGPATTPDDPLRKLVDQLTALQPRLADTDSRLAKDIEQLAASAQKNGTSGQAFQTRLAYALQDAERIVGPLPDVPAGVRDQLFILATTHRGLRNEQVQALLRATPTIIDAHLVRAIRDTASTVAKSPDQHSESITRRVQRLEERAREAALSTAANTLTAAATRPASDITAALPQAPHTQQQQPAAPPRSFQPQETMITREAIGPRALLSVFRTLREPHYARREPWDPPAAPLGPRLATIGDRIAARRDEQALADAERAGRAALDALNTFARGPGAGVMTRIREAARNEPGGFQGVLAEMREGGKYGELRTQFNSALATEKGLGASYDRAAVALSQYGAKRTAADAIISRRPDAAALNGRFETLDAEIGQTASTIPGRKDGKSALDEVAEKARELMTKAVEAVRSFFGRSAGANANTRPTVSPTPGPAS